MYKTSRLLPFLLASGISMAYAGNVYMGPDIVLQDSFSPNDISSFRGIQPRLTVGYAAIIEDLYLAGEVFYGPSTITLQDNYPVGGLSAKSNRSFGISIIPGVSINDYVMGFLRLGIIDSNFMGPNAYRLGSQIGLGMQTNLSKNWDIRAGYTYSSYKSAPGIGAIKGDEMSLSFLYKILC